MPATFSISEDLEKENTMNKMMRKAAVSVTALAMAMITAIVPTFAAGENAPKIKDVEYEGRGKVQVEFRRDVRYRNTTVVATDAEGNEYNTRIVERDEDEIEFKIKNFKKGTTYNFTIKNVKNRRGQGAFTDVNGKVRIPGEKKSKELIGVEKAKEIALKDAGLTGKKVWFEKAKLDRDDGVLQYEIEFRRGYKEYEYDIHAYTERILDKDVEWDD